MFKYIFSRLRTEALRFRAFVLGKIICSLQRQHPVIFVRNYLYLISKAQAYE